MRIQITPPPRLVTIGEVSRVARLTARAIRLYEGQGLVAARRGLEGRRMFDDSAVQDLRYIADLRRVGFSLKEIRNALALGRLEGKRAQSQWVAAECIRKRGELLAQIERLECYAAALGGYSRDERAA